MDTRTIQELVAKMQQGDQQAFSVLYDEFADRIYKFIRIKVSSDPDQAEDIMQEVFVKAWQGCKQLQLVEDLNFSAWLYKIAANTVNDHYRKVYRRPQTVELDPEMNLASKDTSEKLVEDKFNAAAVQAALSQLPQSYREVLELRFLQQFSIEETSKILHKTSLTVRVLQHRAVKKLEKLFKHYE